MKLLLYNSLTKKKEFFCPIDQNLIKMYVCGPTVYDYPHIGNARSVIVYDVLYRILIHLFGFNHVKYVRNITDIDDKIIARCIKGNIPISTLTYSTINSFHEDIEYLGCKKPNIEPRVTDHIQDIIYLIQRLLDYGIAYKADCYVYFDVTKARDYYKFSSRPFERDMYIGRINIESKQVKKNSEDFVLWKPGNADDPESSKFDSPFGKGRPGWHIECSAMSYKYLGDTFDIHGGGIDLLFPHHTNEMAQSCSAFPGSKFAKLWIHNGFLTVNNEKMSKSLGNTITIRDLRNQGVHQDTIRLFLLNTHYRKPIDYNSKAISDAKKIISYWYQAVESLSDIQNPGNISEEFLSCLLCDMNTSNAFKVISKYAKQVHLEQDIKRKKYLVCKILACARFLGLMTQSSNQWFQGQYEDNKYIEYIEYLVSQRSIAKNQKDWLLADKIRDKLNTLQIKIEDKSDGTYVWKKE